jgi:hypothetical protein
LKFARAEGQPNWETTFGRAPDLSPGIFYAPLATPSRCDRIMHAPRVTLFSTAAALLDIPEEGGIDSSLRGFRIGELIPSNI